MPLLVRKDLVIFRKRQVNWELNLLCGVGRLKHYLADFLGEERWVFSGNIVPSYVLFAATVIKYLLLKNRYIFVCPLFWFQTGYVSKLQ